MWNWSQGSEILSQVSTQWVTVYLLFRIAWGVCLLFPGSPAIKIYASHEDLLHFCDSVTEKPSSYLREKSYFVIANHRPILNKSVSRIVHIIRQEQKFRAIDNRIWCIVNKDKCAWGISRVICLFQDCVSVIGPHGSRNLGW